MKLYLSQLEMLLSQIGSDHVKALLLYGPDRGYIDKICRMILRKFNLQQTTIEYNSENIASIELSLNSRNFFCKRELIKIQSVKTSIDVKLKKIITSNFLHFPVFIGDELPVNSSIRKFFETEKNLVSIGCYHDGPEQIEKIILRYCNKAGIGLASDALLYLKVNLKGDHQLICNEITKLLYFTHGQKQIAIDDVMKIINNDIIASGDELCIYFVQGCFDELLKEFVRLKDQNINEILMIRALIRYYSNMYVASAAMTRGQNMDEAIKSLTPAIFYKYIPDFKKNLSTITMKKIVSALSILSNAEVEYKLNPASFDIYKIASDVIK